MLIITSQNNKYTEKESITLARVNAAKSELEFIETEIKNSVFELKEISDQLDVIAKSKKFKEEEIIRLNDSISSLLLENARLDTENNKLKQVQAESISRYCDEVDALQNNIKLANADLKKINDELASQSEKFENRKALHINTLKDLLEKENHTINSIKNLEKLIFVNNDELLLKEELLNKKQLEIKSLENTIIEKNSDINVLNSKIDELNKQIKEKESEYSKSEKKAKSSAEKLEKIIVEIDDASGKLFSIAEREEKLNATIEKIKDLAKKSGININI